MHFVKRYMPRNVRKLASAISVILPFSPLAVVASQEVVPMPSAIGAADVMGVGSGLVVVIAAIMLVGFWYSKSRAVHGSDNNVIKILATQTLGPKERILLNIRIRNEMAPGTEGGVTRHQPSGEVMAIYDAAMRYQAEKVPLIVIGGKEYGTGSSRDWAAKGTKLLGISAVIVESFERIHRSNLVGMGVLPLQLCSPPITAEPVPRLPRLIRGASYSLRALLGVVAGLLIDRISRAA